jgi:hypothetical protein
MKSVNFQGPENGDSMFLGNVGIYLEVQPKRPTLTSSPQSEQQMSYVHEVLSLDANHD